MGIVQNVIGLVRDVQDRQRNAQVNDAMKNYLTDPNAAIAAVNQIDPNKGIALQQNYTQTQNTAADRAQAQRDHTLGQMRDYLRGMPEGTDYGAAMDKMQPFMKAMGIDDNTFNGYKSAVAANPNLLMDDKAYEAAMKDQFTGQVVTPGSIYVRGGKEVLRAPYASKAVETPAGGMTSVFDPNSGTFATPAGSAVPSGGPAPSIGSYAGQYKGAPLTVASMSPLTTAQESGGDYTARNATTGAMGRYQVMPDTGRQLAAKIGVAWRPDMMTKNDAASRKYQDAIGNAAMQESIDFGQGDPARTFAHYYGGSDTKRWGPKTRQYVSDMMGRLTGGAQQPVQGGGSGPSTSATTIVNPKAAPTSYRAATAGELKAAGYPEGTAAQVGSDGKFTNIKTPAGASTKGASNSVPTFEKWQESKVGLDELEHNILKLRDDPSLGTNTGITGALLSHIPGSHRKSLEGTVEQINAQKMIGLLTSLQANGGNPFTRVTNMEAGTLPKTLGNFDLNQNPKDLKANLNSALQQVRAMRSRVNASAVHAGLIDNNGNRLEKGSRAPAAAPAKPQGNVAPVGTIINTSNGRMIKGANGWEAYHG